MGRVASLLTGLILSLCLVTIGVSAQAQAAPQTLDVVALGDSYASGVGAGAYEPSTVGSCYRSANSYSELLVAGLREAGNHVSFTNVTCSGATTETVRQTQLSALDTTTDLVLISVGGNDAGFSAYAGACVVGDCSGAPTQAFLGHLPRVGYAVHDLLRAIDQRAPQAQLLLVGYGQPMTKQMEVPDQDPICERFTSEERRSAATAAGGLDGALLASVWSAKLQGVEVSYISPYAYPFSLRQSFVNHSLCEDAPWYHGFNVLVPGGEGQGAIFHPTPAWQSAVAALLRDRLAE